MYNEMGGSFAVEFLSPLSPLRVSRITAPERVRETGAAIRLSVSDLLSMCRDEIGCRDFSRSAASSVHGVSVTVSDFLTAMQSCSSLLLV